MSWCQVSCGVWCRLGSHLEASWAILSHLGGHLGLSEALLEPSWAILHALTPRGTTVQVHGRGLGGGGVNPSLKGKREGWKRKREIDLNQVRPKKGLLGFYSPPRVLPAARSMGLAGVLSLDIVNGWGFGIASVREVSFRLIRLIKFLMLSPPCTIFSVLQSLWNYKYMSKPTFAVRWQQGMAFLEHSMECAKAQVIAGRIFCFEHPASATSWRQQCVKDVESMPGVHKVTLDQCMLGLRSKGSGIPMRKRTTLLTNSRFIVAAFSGCRCDRSHEHQRIEGAEAGVKRSVWAQRYPEGFVQKLAQCALEHKRSGY